jgi:serine/threonine protein kinase
MGAHTVTGNIDDKYFAKIINLSDPKGETAWTNETYVYGTDSFKNIRLPDVTFYEKKVSSYGSVTQIGVLVMPKAEDITVSDYEEATKVLVALHKMGYTHGDVKPENFVTYESKVKLIDFETTRCADPTMRDGELEKWNKLTKVALQVLKRREMHER